VLGVKPALGRFFVKDEDVVPDRSPVVVISHEFWRRRFSGDSTILGKAVLVNGRQFTVIGVAPQRFSGLMPVLRVDAWVPMMMQAAVRRGGSSLLNSPGSMWLDLVGRLAPGVTQQEAMAELTGLAKQFSQANEVGIPGEIASINLVRMTRISGLPADATKPVLAFFVVLLAVSGLVLLIASVNVAGMLLARAVSRRREIAVRIALGAGRSRLIRQLLTESVLLFTAGGALGVVFAVAATRLLSRIPLPTDVPLAIDAAPDARVLVVTITVAVLTGIVFGLAPAFQASRGDILTTLRGDTSGSGRARSRLRSVLVAGQVAASLLLLTTSGLFVRALAKGHQIDPGFDISHVTTTALDVSLSGYDTTRQRAFYAELRDRVSRLPGVTTVAYTRVVPLSMNNTGYDISVPGYVSPKGGSSMQWTNANAVDAGYFEALKLPILSGRGIRPTDDQYSPNVAVVNEYFAKHYWPGQNPLGKTFKLDSSTTITVIGVTKDVRFAKLDERQGPFAYMPIAQRWRPDVSLLVRTSGEATQLIEPIRAEVRAMDVNLPAPVTTTLERSASAVLLPQRFAVMVTASLGLAGLLLAAIGLYGVLSFSTAQRTREIGVRMALGATREAVLAMIVREGMRVVVIGVAVGLVLAAVATQALVPFLYGVNPLDPGTFVGMTVVLGGVALLASWLPARRAAAGDPMAALRQD
jgi:predicted permease